MDLCGFRNGVWFDLLGKAEKNVINWTPMRHLPAGIEARCFRNGDVPRVGQVLVDGHLATAVADRDGTRVMWDVDGRRYTLGAGISIALTLPAVASRADLEALFGSGAVTS